ncbi:indolethylamine N-methyltransferase-like [Ambystoma mexicanum]|uniref:indolethylamine N-methyltransferase-like n=1 Tax=Ambystoma mexicanum TaxID=8296 RepID=UPI0037E8B5BF
MGSVLCANVIQEEMASNSTLNDFFEKYFDPRKMMQSYTANESSFFDDTILQLFRPLVKTFSSGGVQGETLIDMSAGLYFQYLFPASEHFKEITITVSSDKTIPEVEKWLRDEPGAVDMSYAAKVVAELQGNLENWIENQNIFRTKVKNVLKYDVRRCNPLYPVVLPQADCLLLTHCLECQVTSTESYSSALKNVLTLLKPGGCLLMIVAIEESFYMIGDIKFPHLCIDVGFVTKELTDNQYVIDEIQVFPRTICSLYDLADYTGIAFINAHKETHDCYSNK